MAENKLQQSLFNLISEQLEDENSFGVRFKGDLFNSQYILYGETDENGIFTRHIPYMLTDVIGNYINIPNSNALIGTVGLQYDAFVGFEGESDEKTDEFQYVQYTPTMNAIEELKSKLLSKYYPLGTAYLYMGGEDSIVTINTSSSYANYYIYLKAIFKNTDTETIFRGDSATVGVLSKNATHIIWQVTSGVTISVPYTVDVETEITVSFSSSNVWSITNGTDTDTVTNTAFNASTVYYLGHTTGLEAIVERLVVDNNKDLSDIDLVDGFIDISTWNSKDEVANSGSATIASSTIENCILWSLDGNAVFGFGTNNPISEIRAVDGSALYQLFELEINIAVSYDVLFGNNFEYYLSFDSGSTYEQIYPVDRQHTYGTSLDTVQYINDSRTESMVEESGDDIVLSFYYIPSKKLTKMLKHIVGRSTSQNTKYTLKVQYPFFNIVYNVVIGNGGTSTNLNEFSTFTLTLNPRDTNIT